MAATTALREALNNGISSGSLVDTKIILYSRRESSGRVCRPKALYASSHVLKTVSYFNDMLFGGFAESQLEDFKGAATDVEEIAEGYGYLSDSDLEDDGGEKSSSSKRTAKSKTRPFDLSEKDKIVCETHVEHVEKGKVIKIPDIAFVTFQAFLLYLYTDAIDFAPFGSAENRKSRSQDISSEEIVPRPSPKSIYRLADKYDVPALKTLALNQIRNELLKCDIVEEAFGKFTSKYDEIRDLYVEHLAYIWVEDQKGEVGTSIEEKIDSFVEGDLEHAAEMVSKLWKLVNKEGEIKYPSSTLFTAAEIESPKHWNSVKSALIKSIRTGVFFDRKYWARHSKSGDVLKPVYVSSAIMEDKTQQLSGLVKYQYFTGQGALVRYLEHDINVESDWENDSPEETHEAKPEEAEPVRAVLITGSFSAWKSLFFYRCTDEIVFAPLKSQGVKSRINYIRERTIAAAPPPCSPKSIYVLANLLEIEPLCDTALADIKSKVTLDNVVDEIFSWVTATQEKIMGMETEFLIPNLKNPTLITLMSEKIESIADGSSSHSGDALKLGLLAAVKSKRSSKGVMLLCSRASCTLYSRPISFLKMGVYCNLCSAYGYYYMLCSGCRYQRTRIFEVCQGCQKRFM